MTTKIWIITLYDDKYMISTNERCIWTSEVEAIKVYKEYLEFWKKYKTNKKPILKEYILNKSYCDVCNLSPPLIKLAPEGTAFLE